MESAALSLLLLMENRDWGHKIYILQFSKLQQKGWEWAKWVKGIERYKLPLVKQFSHRDVMYSILTIVNAIIVYLKVAKRVELKSSHHKKKTFLTIWGDRC